MVPEALTSHERKCRLGHVVGVKRQDQRNPRNRIAFIPLDHRPHDVVRRPTALDLLKGPVAKCEESAIQGMGSESPHEPVVNVPIAPEFLLSPGKLEDDGYWRPHPIAVEELNLVPAFGRMVGEIAYQPERSLWLLGEETGERLVNG